MKPVVMGDKGKVDEFDCRENLLLRDFSRKIRTSKVSTEKQNQQFFTLLLLYKIYVLN